MKIKAAVVDEKGADFKIRDDVELAPMGPDDLQVHMVASGICHSDEALRIGDAVIGYPIVLGHEGSGIVEKVGPEVTQFKPGDHVVLSFYACGNCKNCLKGIPTQCLNYAHNNLSGTRPDGSAHFTENGKPVADMFDVMRLKLTKILICASLDRLVAAMSQVPEPFCIRSSQSLVIRLRLPVLGPLD